MWIQQSVLKRKNQRNTKKKKKWHYQTTCFCPSVLFHDRWSRDLCRFLAAIVEVEAASRSIRNREIMTFQIKPWQGGSKI